MPGSKPGDSLRIQGPTTGRTRRHEISDDPSLGLFEPSALIPAASSAPSSPPRSIGDYSTASIETLAEVLPGHFCPSEKHLYSKRRRILEFFGHLAPFSGDTWQERWEASGYDRGDRQVGDLAGDDLNYRGRLNTALGHAFAMRIIRPSLLGFRVHKFTCYSPWFRSVAQDPWLEEFCERADRLPVGSGRRSRAKFDVCCALTVFGIDLKDLTAEAFLYYCDQSRKHRLVDGTKSAAWAGTLAWPILCQMGHFASSTPSTLRAAVSCPVGGGNYRWWSMRTIPDPTR